MIRAFYLKAFVCLLAFSLLAACSSGARRKKVAFVTNNTSDFWTIARRGCEKADQEIDDIEVEFRIPSDGTAAEQKRIFDDLLAKDVAGIAISPVDPANQTQMINDATRQAVIVTQDSDAPSSNRAAYLGTDNRAAGRQAGELIKEALPDGGQIMVFVGKIDAQNAQDRFQGIKDALEGSKVQIVDVRTDDTDLVRAKSNAADALVAHPELDCLVGLWSYNGPAILNAVRDAGKTGQIKIVCFDEDEQTLAGIRDGAIYATVVQQPYEFGYQSIQLLDKLMRGDTSMIPPGKQIFVPTLIIKKAGVEEFIEKINKLRGRT
jgi:ribose transport system substrate-binding protein